MAVYRNQSNTMSQITMLSRLRITTTQEAVAFLRAIQPLHEQVAAVLQTASLKRQQAINRAIPNPVVPTPEPVPTPTPEPEKRFEAENLSADEGYSETEVEARVEKLKAAKSTEKSRKVNKKSQQKVDKEN